MEGLSESDPRSVSGYRLLGRLGAGGMGQVFLAVSPAGARVAMKVILPHLGDQREFRTRFRREVAAARAVRSPYVAQVVDADPTDEPPWLATEYIAGPSLAEAVRTCGPLPSPAAAALAAAAAEALLAIGDAGLVHRDLKPSNILLDVDGPRVIDFGIAKAAEASELTQTGVLIGTPGFMAPEQIDSAPLSSAADVFSLGAVLAFALTGVGPFGVGTPQAVIGRVLYREPDLEALPAQWRDLLQQCLAKTPAERPTLRKLIDRLVPDGRPVASLFGPAWLPDRFQAHVQEHTLIVDSQVPSFDAGRAEMPLTTHRAPTVLASPPPVWTAPIQPSGTALDASRRPRRRWPFVLAGSAAAAALLAAGALLVLPRLADSEDTHTSDPFQLTGDPPTHVTSTWQIELPAGQGNTTVRATAGGLAVDEVHGVRMVDPDDGQTRWHWRDDAYDRVAVALAAEGRTIVLGLDFDGQTQGRDRLVALDTTTGELLWDRSDDDVVTAMASLGVAHSDGDWLAVPNGFQGSAQSEFDPTASDSPVGLRLVDLATGQTRWGEAGTEGCTLSSIGAGSPDVVVIVERCPPPAGSQAGTQTCQVAGVSIEDGSRLWSWPDGAAQVNAAQEYASECRANTLAGTVFLSFQATAFDSDPGAAVEQTPALALDPRTGEVIWAVEREEDGYSDLGVDGLTDLREVVGGRTIGVEWPSGSPGVGAAVLILRDVADGTRIGQVDLPEGQPVVLRAAGEDWVMLTHYLPDSDQVQLLEVDLVAGQVASEVPVGSGTESGQLSSAGLAVGPGTVAVDTLIAPGAEPDPADLRLVVHGFG